MKYLFNFGQHRRITKRLHQCYVPKGISHVRWVNVSFIFAFVFSSNRQVYSSLFNDEIRTLLRAQALSKVIKHNINFSSSNWLLRFFVSFVGQRSTERSLNILFFCVEMIFLRAEFLFRERSDRDETLKINFESRFQSSRFNRTTSIIHYLHENRSTYNINVIIILRCYEW